MEKNQLQRITINPKICHGKPTIRNTRHMVEGIIEYLAGGDSINDILHEFPDLGREDILACLAFAAKFIQFKDIEFLKLQDKQNYDPSVSEMLTSPLKGRKPYP